MVNPHFQINVILQGFVWEKIILRSESTSMNKQQDGATSESSSNSTQYLIFGLNFRLLNIYLSCKLVVTCASSQY